MTESAEPIRRGDVWLVALGAARPGEPGKVRPAVVVSADELTTGHLDDLVVVVPLSSSASPSQLRVEIAAGAAVDRPSRAVVRALRGLTAARLLTRLGRVTNAELIEIDVALEMVLDLDITT